MYYRRPLHSLSGVYRPLPTQRFIMMTMGGYWPIIQKLHNGHLGVVTRDSDFHIGERGRLVFVHSPDGGESWSHATVISEDGSDNRNPAFGVTSNGTLLASFIVQVNYTDGVYDTVDMEPTPLYLARSEDHGQTWPTELAKVEGYDRFIVGSPFGKMITRADGGVMMHYHLDGVTGFISSYDDGRTWTGPTVISDGGYNETGLCNLGDGKFLAVFRDDAEGALSQSRSDDDGATWSAPVRITEPAEHPGDVIKLADGRVLLTYGRRTTPFGVFGLVSHDDGRTWDEQHRLFIVADGGRDLGYPSSIQREDGAVVTVYYSDQLIVPGPRRETIGIHGAAVVYRPEDLP
jgi:sialidase-1